MENRKSIDLDLERRDFEASGICTTSMFENVMWDQWQFKYVPLVREKKINDRFLGWKAAKSQATPEGFVLDAPARVGGGVFREGVKWETVIESAQRLYEHSKDEINPIVSPADMLKIACGELVLVPKDQINKPRKAVTLTCSELLEAFQFGAPDGEGDEDQMVTEMTIEWFEDGHSGKGYYAYYSELPEEGAIKLGEEQSHD
ncbi:hypothetical protein I6M90_01105 [Acinetobacter bereziniae]|uniref:hypothetical protein n=1 Tax=Acinetobacter bereziniae TaxID=106648 RepID=UPI001900CFD4|nr:hypothetical protein [Acinetobacter bereziniae]MBJ8454671.1 hypothetical protein [Acinetobacter bereziniae]